MQRSTFKRSFSMCSDALITSPGFGYQEKGVTKPDGTPLAIGTIGLGPKSERVRKTFSAEFQEYLKSRNDWFEFIGGFRHALAHRISLYIPPYVISPEQEAKYREYETSMVSAMRRNDFREYDRLSIEQMKLAKFRPWMQHSYEEKVAPIVFHPQLIADFKTIDEFGWKMLGELKTAAV